jgi:mono/diheme cytochrome c family protein
MAPPMTVVRSDYRPKRASLKKRKQWLAFCGFVLTVEPPAHAADVAKGRSLAQNVCSQCHGITAHQAGWTNAPSFAEIASKPTTTPASLEAVIARPHPKMSPSAQRTPSEAADLAAYILSLRRK